MNDFKALKYNDIIRVFMHRREIQRERVVKEHTLFYVLEGAIDINEQGNITTLHSGECAFIRRDHRVRLCHHTGNEGAPHRSMAFNFPHKLLMQYWHTLKKRDLPRDAKGLAASVLKIPARPDVKSLFQSFMPYFDFSLEPDEEWIKLKLAEGIQAILRTDENVYASLFDFTTLWRTDIMTYMEENYKYNLSVQELAHYTGRSLSTFKRDFKKVCDITPEKWIVNRRLEEAYKLLKANQLQVQEVAMEVGFTNLSYFSRAFKDKYGISPSQVDSDHLL